MRDIIPDSGAYAPSRRIPTKIGGHSGAYAPKTGRKTVVYGVIDRDSGAYAPSLILLFSVLFVYLPFSLRKGIWQEKQKE